MKPEANPTTDPATTLFDIRAGRRLLLTTALAGLALAQPALAQDTTLISVFHENFSGGNTTSVTLFGTPGTTGTIANTAGLSQSFEIGADGAALVDFNPEDVTVLTDGTVRDTALFINASNPITALATNQLDFTTDMTALLDTAALGREYVVLAYEQPTDTQPSQVSITAVTDGTEVTFTPPETLSGFEGGQTHTVTLDAGQSLGLEGVDATGTVISASADVAVFGGGQCATVPTGLPFCDHLISQNYSTENFATDFRMVQTPLAGEDADLVRLVTATDGTEIFIDGVSQGTIDRGEFLEVDNVGNAHITATNPVQLGQYMRGDAGSRELGDPAFAVVPGTDQLLASYVFSIPVDSDGEAAFAENYLMVVIGGQAADTLLLNEELVSEEDYDERVLLDGFVHGTIEIDAGVSTVSADEEFLAMIAGFDVQDSYLTTFATAFSPGASPPRQTVLPSEPEYEAAPRIVATLSHVRAMRDRRERRILGGAAGGAPVVSSQGGAAFTPQDADPMARGAFWLNLPVARTRPRDGDFALVDSMRQTTFGLQAGYDFPSMEAPGGDVVIGTFVEYQRARTRITSMFGANRITTNALGVGATATWFGQAGTYVDVVGRAMRLRNAFETGAGRQDARALTLSVEVGHDIGMGDGWTVTPQAQLSYAAISMDDVEGVFGETAQFGSTNSLQARIGAALRRNWVGARGETNRLFVSADLIGERGFSPVVDVTTAGGTASYEGRNARTQVELGAGGDFEVSPDSFVSAAVYAGRGLGSGGNTSLRAELGATLHW